MRIILNRITVGKNYECLQPNNLFHQSQFL